MSAPPPYPRTPYLWRPDQRSVALVAPGEVDSWYTEQVLVEEKLDGANVSLWLEGGSIRAAPRGGRDAMDRARQMGRLRAWTAEHDIQLRPLLANCTAIYGEWLWRRHTVAYDHLPDWLVVLDLWSTGRGFVPAAEKTCRVEEQRLCLPPVLFEGVLGSRESLEGLMVRSRFGSETMEGAVLRRDGLRCKVVHHGFSRKTDADWAKDRTHNSVVPD